MPKSHDGSIGSPPHSANLNPKSDPMIDFENTPILILPPNLIAVGSDVEKIEKRYWPEPPPGCEGLLGPDHSRGQTGPRID